MVRGDDFTEDPFQVSGQGAGAGSGAGAGGGHASDGTEWWNNNQWTEQPASGGDYGYGSLLQGWNTPFNYTPFEGVGAYNAPTFDAPDYADVINDPAFKARIAMGEDAIEKSAAARGTLLSGGTMKDLTKYGQDYASNEYNNQYQRELAGYQANASNQYQAWAGNADQQYRNWQTNYQKSLDEYRQAYSIFNQNQSDTFNRLFSLAGLGQNAANNQSSQDANYAQMYASLLGNNTNAYNEYLSQAANAQASGSVGAGNSWMNGLGNTTNNLMSLYMLSRMNNGVLPTGTQNPYAQTTSGGGTSSYSPNGGLVWSNP